jgi:hypothetical protein
VVRSGRALLAVVAVLSGIAVGVPSRAVAADAVAATPDLIELNAVACLQTGDCLAVGQDVTSGRSFAETWTGTTWRVLPPVAAPGSAVALWDVTCSSAVGCIAVGSYADTSGFGFTLAASWNGVRWRLLAPASPGIFDGLSGIACPAPRLCVAVGATLVTSFKTLAEAWDGTHWRLLPTPTPGGWGALNAIACPLPTRCIAVGSTGYGGIRRPLALDWDGNQWRALVPPPSPDGYGNLVSVSCAGPSTCVAAGYAGVNDQAGGQPLVESWNGSAWQPLPLPGR